MNDVSPSKRLENIGNDSISIVTLFLAVVLVLYMVVVVVVNCAALLTFLFSLSSHLQSDMSIGIQVLNGIGPDFLHGVAIFVILIKAYKVLISYAKHHHISIKYIAEIAIVAGVLEILFNIKAYSIEQIGIIALFSIGIFFMYLWKYELFQRMR